MSKFLSLFLKYFPSVLAGVVAVEQSVGSSAPGTAKKIIVLNAIAAGASVGTSVPNGDVAGISALIDTTVGALNDSGVFTHGVPAAPAGAATGLAGLTGIAVAGTGSNGAIAGGPQLVVAQN